MTLSNVPVDNVDLSNFIQCQHVTIIIHKIMKLFIQLRGHPAVYDCYNYTPIFFMILQCEDEDNQTLISRINGHNTEPNDWLSAVFDGDTEMLITVANTNGISLTLDVYQLKVSAWHNTLTNTTEYFAAVKCFWRGYSNVYQWFNRLSDDRSWQRCWDALGPLLARKR